MNRLKLEIYKARPALIAAVLVLAVLLPATTGSAHTGTPPVITCTTLTADFNSFQTTGPHTVSFTGTVNGTPFTKTGSFTGYSGTVTVDISDLTTATGPLAITAKASWTDEGGGNTTTSEKTLTCHEVPSEPPPASTPQVVIAVQPIIRFTG